jgi:hypothetical protein
LGKLRWLQFLERMFVASDVHTATSVIDHEDASCTNLDGPDIAESRLDLRFVPSGHHDHH